MAFRARSFDVAFAFSVFQYFPNLPYAAEVVREMRRVSRRAILIGDLPRRSRRRKHLLFAERLFLGADVYPGFYTADRFNVVLTAAATSFADEP